MAVVVVVEVAVAVLVARVMVRAVARAVARVAVRAVVVGPSFLIYCAHRVPISSEKKLQEVSVWNIQPFKWSKCCTHNLLYRRLAG